MRKSVGSSDIRRTVQTIPAFVINRVGVNMNGLGDRRL